MPRLPFGRRAGFSFATAGSALVLALAVAAPACGSYGSVTVTLGTPS